MKFSLKSIMKPKMAAGGCMGPSCPGCMGPNCMSKGGEATDSDIAMDGDQEGDESEDLAMQDACAGELLDALERKDKAGILEAMRAIILSVR